MLAKGTPRQLTSLMSTGACSRDWMAVERPPAPPAAALLLFPATLPPLSSLHVHSGLK